jgi:hypothetical protein
VGERARGGITSLALYPISYLSPSSLPAQYADEAFSDGPSTDKQEPSGRMPLWSVADESCGPIGQWAMSNIVSWSLAPLRSRGSSSCSISYHLPSHTCPSPAPRNFWGLPVHLGSDPPLGYSSATPTPSYSSPLPIHLKRSSDPTSSRIRTQLSPSVRVSKFNAKQTPHIVFLGYQQRGSRPPALGPALRERPLRP